MTLADLRQPPITRHAPVALETTHTRSAFALTGLGVASVGNAAEPVAVAQTRTTRAIRSESGGFAIRATTVPRVRAFHHLNPLDWKSIDAIVTRRNTRVPREDLARYKIYIYILYGSPKTILNFGNITLKNFTN